VRGECEERNQTVPGPELIPVFPAGLIVVFLFHGDGVVSVRLDHRGGCWGVGPGHGS